MTIEKAYSYTLAETTKDIDEWVEEIVKSFEEKTSHKMNEYEIGVLESAIGYRLSTYKLGKEFGGEVFNDILGIYTASDEKNKKEYIIEINSEPVHVLNRTTGRAGYSCEQIKGDWWLGPFHDIALRNATAYFYEDKPGANDVNWVGRLNLRWCIDDNGKFNIGIDPNIYPTWVPTRDDDFLEMAVWSIVLSAGYLNYTHGSTPYIYKGHSDTTVSGGVKLPFKGLKFYR